MAKSSFKVNVFDAICVAFVVLVLVICGIAWKNQPYLGSDNVLVTVKITDSDTIGNISSQLGQAGTVCVDSNRYCGTQVDSNIFVPVGTGASFATVVIRGLGDISKDKSIFLGHRIYANQVVQLRGNYVADGTIIDFKYEN